MKILENVSLAGHTTLGLGGPARYWLDLDDRQSLPQAFDWARPRQCPVLVLGAGSNMVIGDAGFPGLVIHVRLRGVSQDVHADHVDVTAAAGEPWDDVVRLAIDRGWAGLECLSGIPGRVGATPMQNVGAYGQEVSDTIIVVEAFDSVTGTEVTFTKEACQFAYRQSRFKQADAGRYVILSVTYRLTPGPPGPIRYGELSRALDGAPGLAQVREAVLRLRTAKGMVLDPQDPDTRSVGSFFMNPVVSRQQARSIGQESMPQHDVDAEHVKLSAAWLIERAGFKRGWGHGSVAISSKHTLALVHRGGGTTAQLLALASEVQAGVFQRLGVHLVPEPNLIGCSLTLSA